MLTHKQREKRAMQGADIAGDLPSIFDEKELIEPKLGHRVEFLDEELKQFSGKVRRIYDDQWRSIVIDYGVEGRSHIILPSKLTALIKQGKARIVVPQVKIGCSDCKDTFCGQVNSKDDIEELYGCEPDIVDGIKVKCCYFCSKRKNCEDPCEHSKNWKVE